MNLLSVYQNHKKLQVVKNKLLLGPACAMVAKYCKFAIKSSTLELGRYGGSMKKLIMALVVMGFVSIVGFLRADSYKNSYRKISSAGRFYEYIEPVVKDQVSLGVALFYNSNEAKVQKQQDRDITKEARARAQAFARLIKKQIHAQLDEFKRASRGIKEVEFYSIDLADKNNKQLASRFAIRYSPEIRLFKRGKQVRVDDKVVAIKGDFAQEIMLDESIMLSFVKKHFSRDIQLILQAKAKARRELELARASAPRFTSVAFGMGYGPYGWGGGWGGPYWGMGMGWGGGWGGGWGCYRCGFGWCC